MPEILLRPQPHHLQDMWLGLVNFFTCFLFAFLLFLSFFFETEPHCIAWAGLKMNVLLPELGLQEFLTTLRGLVNSVCQNGPSYKVKNPVLTLVWYTVSTTRVFLHKSKFASVHLNKVTNEANPIVKTIETSCLFCGVCIGDGGGDRTTVWYLFTPSLMCVLVKVLLLR